MNDISKNIKNVLIVFLLCFIATIVYLTYFEIFLSPDLVINPMNKRSWAKRNEILRGTIYDKNMKPLTKSSRKDVLTQNREYIGGEMFAHVLGYVDVKYGITGLERKYDSDLMADDSPVVDLFNIFNDEDNSALENIIEVFKERDDKIGRNVITTLDYNVQKTAFEMLGNRRGAVVALNPKTGEIISLVSKPSFDPNNIGGSWEAINSDESRPLLNRAVSGLYPPGSTFKVVTASSALENTSNILNRTFQDNGVLQFNSTQSLSNYNNEVLGNISFREAFVKSSNVVFASLGLEIGNNALKETAENFCFNREIEADGIFIDKSVFPSYKRYEVGNIAQSAIGQSGVLASPMEMALVASTIANDGTMMKPTLVKSVTTKKGSTVKELEPEVIAQPIEANNADVLKKFMREVVTNGTGGAANIEGLDICGKTGTAEHSEGGAPHSWFIGFAPYQDPQIAVAVIVENGGLGGGEAARIAAEVIRTNFQE